MYFRPSKGSPLVMVLTLNDPQEDFEDFLGILGSFFIPLSAELILAPFGDESLLVRFQESQINAFPKRTNSNLPSSIPLGMEYIQAYTIIRF